MANATPHSRCRGSARPVDASYIPLSGAERARSVVAREELARTRQKRKEFLVHRRLTLKGLPRRPCSSPPKTRTGVKNLLEPGAPGVVVDAAELNANRKDHRLIDTVATIFRSPNARSKTIKDHRHT